MPASDDRASLADGFARAAASSQGRDSSAEPAARSDASSPVAPSRAGSIRGSSPASPRARKPRGAFPEARQTRGVAPIGSERSANLEAVIAADRIQNAFAAAPTGSSARSSSRATDDALTTAGSVQNAFALTPSPERNQRGAHDQDARELLRTIPCVMMSLDPLHIQGLTTLL